MKELPSTRQQLELLDAYLQIEDRRGHRIAIMHEIIRLAEILEHKEAAMPIIQYEIRYESQIIYENYNLHRRKSKRGKTRTMHHEIRVSAEILAG